MDDRKRSELIDALASAVYGDDVKKPGEDAGIGVRFEKSTGSIKFMLSGTEYTISQVADAADYFKSLAARSVSRSDKTNNDIAFVCISEILRQFNMSGAGGAEQQ